MLRIVRIALLALVPTLALGALATGCGDDTTVTPVGGADLSVPTGRDMITPPHDMAQTD